jgi:hypothetical protein
VHTPLSNVRHRHQQQRHVKDASSCHGMLLNTPSTQPPNLLLLLRKLSAATAMHENHTMAGAVPIGYLFEPAGQQDTRKTHNKQSKQSVSAWSSCVGTAVASVTHMLVVQLLRLITIAVLCHGANCSTLNSHCLIHVLLLLLLWLPRQCPNGSLTS